MKKWLYIILVLGFVLRIYGLQWDQGNHLHPDERMLIMVADRLHFWDQLNPDFFAYGTLPIYLLKGSSQLLDILFHTHLTTFDNLLYVGRIISVLFDLGTLLVVYLLTKKLFKDTAAALFSALFYAITFFAIQNSHFFVVDVLLTFFLTSLLYSLMLYLEKPSYMKLFFVSLFIAAAMATKISAVIFVPVVFFTVIAAIIIESRREKTFSITQLVITFILLLNFSVLLHFLFMPYAYLTLEKFLHDTLQQSAMSKNAYIFPYTLQYVGTTPYLYFLKNIFFWGLGPVISILAVCGVVFGMKSNHSNLTHFKKILPFMHRHSKFVLFGAFYLLYFLVIGPSAVKFMRYMLPVYPALVILAGYGLYRIKKHSPIGSALFVILAAVWTLSFINIYSVENTRVTATKWIIQNIPFNSHLAVEHWDDRIPIKFSENYTIEDLTLYDIPDNAEKWRRIDDVLARSEYIIIASNRLYTPLQRLVDCKKYRVCYPLTAQYYQRLFQGQLGYEKVAEFKAEPKLPLLPIYFSDQSADESFTVYDHPTIMIFKRK
ncbi:MAG: glycosyltransferase family 39 protein [Patescibacteria group bacterium]